MQSYIIECLVMNSLICWGARFAFMDGNLLYPITVAYAFISWILATVIFGLLCLVAFIPMFIYMMFFSIDHDRIVSAIKSGYSKLIGGLDWILEYLSEPLWGCLICMSSVWGILFLVVMGPDHVTSQPLCSAMTVLYLFALCGLNWVSSMFVEKMVSSNNKNAVS